VRSFSALEVIEIVTATVHESASDAHGSPPLRQTIVGKGRRGRQSAAVQTRGISTGVAAAAPSAPAVVVEEEAGSIA
jgi:hypothetical protein